MAVLVLFLGAACISPWEPSLHYRAIAPPALYRVVWEETAACVSQTVPLRGLKFEEVSWFLVEAAEEFWVMEEGRAIGAATRSGRIYLVEKYREHPLVLAHESAHAMTGIFDHPDDPFRRCRLTWDTYVRP